MKNPYVYLVASYTALNKWYEFWKPDKDVVKSKILRKDAEQLMEKTANSNVYVNYNIEEI